MNSTSPASRCENSDQSRLNAGVSITCTLSSGLSNERNRSGFGSTKVNSTSPSRCASAVSSAHADDQPEPISR